MPKLIDLTGKTFNRLTILSRDFESKDKTRWFCKCSCGKILENSVTSTSITSNKRKSCGCLQKENNLARCFKHGMTKTKPFRIWQNIKNRCFNKNVPSYSGYGERGILMYEEWINNFQSFYEYINALENAFFEGFTLDRIDNNNGYYPNNLKWSTDTQQARNRRNTKFSEETAKNIREIYATGDYSQREIAKMFGVAKNSIFSIIHNITWKTNV